MQVTLKLKITTDQKHSLVKTAYEVRESFNRVCLVGWEDKSLNGVALHKATYYTERELTTLPSQLVCSARVKATEAIKSAKARLKKKESVSCPVSKTPMIRYDARSANVKLKERSASLASIDGRVKVKLKIPEYYNNRLDWKVCSSDLIVRKNGDLFLHVVVEKESEVFKSNEKFTGVDLGVNRPAVTSDNHFFGKRSWKNVEQKNFNLKRALQAKGTDSAKRHLVKLSRRVNRFRNDCDHVISKRIIENADRGTTIVLEDLCDIRKRVKARKQTRRSIHSWSFARLKNYLTYKGEQSGIHIDFVDPRYTSQKCSCCGYTHKRNRKTQSLFLCRSCGFSHNADLNASKNIRNNYLAARGTPSLSGLPSTSLS